MNYRITFYILLLVVVAIEGIDWAKYEESIKNLQLNQTMLDYYKEIYSEEDGLTSKFNCPPLPKGISGDTVHNLTPMDIKVIGAIGDSLTAGNGASAKTIIGCLTQYRGTSWSVGGDDDVHKRTTLPNILRFYNPTLYGFSLKKSKRDDIKLSKFNLAYPGNVASDMLGQAKMLVDRMTSDPVVDMKSDWKIVSLFIGGNDLCDVCNEPEKLSAKNYVKHIEEALDYLHENLPKTFVNLVNVLDVPLVQQLNYKHFFCPLEHFIICKCGAYPKKSQESSMQDIVREYQYEVENLIADGRYDTKDDFTVVVQPFMTYMEVPKKKNGKADMSYFAPDCFHFSAKGQAAAGEALWNNMLEPIGHKRRNWTIGEIFKCPNESFPYFYTSKNSVSLHMNKRLSVNAGHQIPARTGQKHSNKFALTFSIIGIIACTVVAIGVVIARKHSRNARNSHLPLVDELATNYNVPTEENIFHTFLVEIKIYPDDVDLENRDPNLINDHLQIGVEDIFGEPNDISSCECAWKNALVIYNNSLQICYRILSGLCCCPLALCWGCTMACVAFNNIWCCTPTARLYSILMTIWRKIISICILSCIAPYYEAIGYLFSNIRLSLFKSPQADDHYEAKFIKVYDPKLKSSNA